MIYLIAGLGNIGVRFDKTRHNVGFMLLDYLCDSIGIKFEVSKKFHGAICEIASQGSKLILLKPHTFMNESGQSVSGVIDFYKIRSQNVIIAYDDLETKFSRCKVRLGGGAGGHNGIRSIDKFVADRDYFRLKIGISRPPSLIAVHDYVLESFQNEEILLLPLLFQRILDTVLMQIIECGNLSHLETLKDKSLGI